MTEPKHIQTSPIPSIAQASAGIQISDQGVSDLAALVSAVAESLPEAPKHQRKQQRTINVPYSEREYPPEVQLKLHTLRAEIHRLNKALSEKNARIKGLSGELRLRSRVMRLKSESYAQGAAMEARIQKLSKAVEDAAAEAGEPLEVSSNPGALPEQAATQ